MDNDAVDICAGFVGGAPPGELGEVVSDIKNIVGPGIVDHLTPAFKRYNEEQFITTRLPGGGDRQVIVSRYGRLPDGRYLDTGGGAGFSSFRFDHKTQEASDVRPHAPKSALSDLVTSTLEEVGRYAEEHFPQAAYGAWAVEDDTKVAVVMVANKYSPSNFWNGRWRSAYIFQPETLWLEGTVMVDVHYYEDGNVRLQTNKPLSLRAGSATGGDITRAISAGEKSYHGLLNRAFTNLSEGVFKKLRRQLPVTRQKIEWEKVASYRLGQDIGGGSSR